MTKKQLILISAIITAGSISGCDKMKGWFQNHSPKLSKKKAVGNFKIDCPGKNSACSSSQVTVTNISKMEYDSLVVVCKDKKNPDAPPDKPYYTFPFSLNPKEVKCVDAVENCMREKVKDQNTGEMIDSYVTLLQLNSDNKPKWKQYQDCN